MRPQPGCLILLFYIHATHVETSEGPPPTASIPGNLPPIRPHSRPAWMAPTLWTGSPVSSCTCGTCSRAERSKRTCMDSRRAEICSRRFVQRGRLSGQLLDVHAARQRGVVVCKREWKLRKDRFVRDVLYMQFPPRSAPGCTCRAGWKAHTCMDSERAEVDMRFMQEGRLPGQLLACGTAGWKDRSYTTMDC
jgi:hypothetical protein